MGVGTQNDGVPFDTCAYAPAVAWHGDAKISTAACGSRHRTVGHIGRRVDFVAVDCQHTRGVSAQVSIGPLSVLVTRTRTC